MLILFVLIFVPWCHMVAACTYCMGSRVSSLSRIYLYSACYSVAIALWVACLLPRLLFWKQKLVRVGTNIRLASKLASKGQRLAHFVLPSVSKKKMLYNNDIWIKEKMATQEQELELKLPTIEIDNLCAFFPPKPCIEIRLECRFLQKYFHIWK